MFVTGVQTCALPISLKEFLNSPPHRAILLDSQYHAVGVGAYEVNGRKNWAVLLSLNSAAEPLAATQAETRKTVGGFSDVYEDDYFAKPVLWAVKSQVTNGQAPAPSLRARPVHEDRSSRSSGELQDARNRNQPPIRSGMCTAETISTKPFCGP